MKALAIRKTGGLCPAGTLAMIYRHYKNHQTFERVDFTRECDAAGFMELTTLLPGFPLRRVPRLAKIALRGALEVADPPFNNCALIISTVYSSVTTTFEFLDSILHDGAHLASPTAFSHSVTNMTAAFVSQGLCINGPCLTITQTTLQPALEIASALLASGQVDNVLWGIVSEQSRVMEGIECRSNRESFSLNDGAVFFHLTLPDLKIQTPLIDILENQPVPNSRQELDDHLADAIGSGPLALATRLALTGLCLSESSGESTTRIVNEGREAFVLMTGGGA